MGDLMDFLMKADDMSDVLMQDPKDVIETADELRSRGWKNVRITDLNDNPVDEAALRKAANSKS
jgi:hypothetical protein